MLTVATHSGTFHADDVFAYVILKAAHPDGISLLRSRSGEVLDTAQIVFDVGGRYDPPAGRYDHHMRDRPLRDEGVPFSSAGLIWRDYGMAALGALLPAATEEERRTVLAMVDHGLIRDVDLMDNGEMPPTDGHLSTVLEAMNPTFLEDERDETSAFHQAAEVASAILGRVTAHAHAAVRARETVAEAARNTDDPRILVLERRVPWEEAIFELDLNRVLYVIRPAGQDWTCSAVPPERGSFGQRHPLPEAWGGLRDDALAVLTGVADATFCHPARFVCGAHSRDGAVTLARLAVKTP